MANSRTSRVAAFQRLSRLPAFHPTALRLLAVSTESYSALSDFEAVFRSDPSLTADLLVAANSPVFGLRARVETIRHALTLLGIDRVRSLAHNVMFASYMQRLPPDHIRSIWSHSIATAVISDIVGEIYGIPGMYTLGLMHDVGRLALLLSVGQQYADFLASEVSSISESIEWETALCGMSHSDAGALLAQTWGFPEILQVAMVCHHGISSTGATDAPAVVQIACQMADWFGFPELNLAEGAERPMLPYDVLRSPRLEPERVLDEIGKQSAPLQPQKAVR
jgi:HD-like signal output (HDOD) protein